MKIIICASISAASEVLKTKTDLEAAGYTVTIPEGISDEFLRKRTQVSTVEKAEDKIKYGLIRGYYEKIKQSDIVLVVNPDRNNIKGYIGGNTLIEMAFAHVLNKKLYVLYPLPDMPYTPELLAMQPLILNGKLDQLK